MHVCNVSVWNTTTQCLWRRKFHIRRYNENKTKMNSTTWRNGVWVQFVTGAWISFIMMVSHTAVCSLHVQPLSRIPTISAVSPSGGALMAVIINHYGRKQRMNIWWWGSTVCRYHIHKHLTVWKQFFFFLLFTDREGKILHHRYLWPMPRLEDFQLFRCC